MLLEYDHATSRRDCPLDTSAPFSVLTRPLYAGASGVVPFHLSLSRDTAVLSQSLKLVGSLTSACTFSSTAHLF